MTIKQIKESEFNIIAIYTNTLLYWNAASVFTMYIIVIGTYWISIKCIIIMIIKEDTSGYTYRLAASGYSSAS